MSQKLMKLADKYFQNSLKFYVKQSGYLLRILLNGKYQYEGQKEDAIQELIEILNIVSTTRKPGCIERFPGVRFWMFGFVELYLRDKNIDIPPKDDNREELLEKLKPDFNLMGYEFLLDDFNVMVNILDHYNINEIKKYASLKNDPYYKWFKKMKTQGKLQQTIIDKIDDCYIINSILESNPHWHWVVFD